jgi:aspartate kinase
VIVMKFGGTSVQSAERIQRVCELITRRVAEQPVVVTSAMAGITNQLLTAIELARRGDSSWRHHESELRTRHLEQAGLLAAHDAEPLQAIESLCEELRILLRGVSLAAEAPVETVDQILGFGELLAQQLLTSCLRGCGVRPVHCDAREVVVTDACFGAARVDHALTRARAARLIAPLCAAGQIPVLGGYIGATRDGRPTTLGRGGSDLSASVLGLALDVAAIEIWTDVDGLMTADPRLVRAARLLEHATFGEAAELAGFGAKVLHPASIDPAVRAGIPVYIRNSLDPTQRGTRIDQSGAAASPSGVRAIALRPAQALIMIEAPGANRDPDFFATLLRTDVVRGGELAMLVPGPFGVDLVLQQASTTPAGIEALGRFGRVQVERSLALIALVGEAVACDPQALIRVLSVLAPQRYRRVSPGPRGASVHLLVAEAEAPALMQTLHRELIEREAA